MDRNARQQDNMPTIFEIADHILANTPSPYGLTNRELQKLLYLAQGFYLAQSGEALFQEDFQAWKYGPVNYSIFHKYKHFGYHDIDRPNKETLKPISEKMTVFILGLTISFCTVGPRKLIEYSHADTPWSEKYIPNQNICLPKENLKTYFENFTSFEEYKAVAEGKLQFHSLIDSRLEYLRKLPLIGNAWISGEAAAPTERTSEVAVGFLAGLERRLFSNHAKPIYPKLIMGPIPSGGISLEFKSYKSTYINLHNSEVVDIEFENDGNFEEFEVALGVFEENFAEVYGKILA
ncbi:Panacea domain-containing protein [Pseudomonas syringae]|uniref:Panacea domain-containing protein n=1 Tax=Pseudomonas syringae TaxID=317 RepID=UPI0034D54FF3